MENSFWGIFLQLGLPYGVPTSSVQKDWSNARGSSPDPGFLWVIPRSSGSSGSLDLGFLGFVLLCFVLLCRVLLCLCFVLLRFAVLCLAKLILAKLS